MMESVVSEGTGKNAKVAGFRVGGKTGTSEDGVHTNKYVTSFVGVAPISNPKVAILVILYNPTGKGGHQGGAVAAPVAGQILGEVLPYLDFKEDNDATQIKQKTVTIPDLKYKTVKEAEKMIKENDLKIQYDDKGETLDKEKKVIRSQDPKAGVTVYAGSCIHVILQ